MADRRDEIVRAALALLREEGAKGLSQPQVAKRAGIPQGHLTYYFPKKADLVAAAARKLQDEMQAELVALGMKAARSGDTHAAAVEVLTTLVLDTERSRALLGLTIESERDPEVHDVLLGIVEAGRPALAAILGVPADDPTVDLLQAVAWGLELQQLLHRRGRAAVRALVERLIAWIETSTKRRTKKRGAP